MKPFWGSSWAEDAQNFYCERFEGETQDFCRKFEQAVRNRVENIAVTLASIWDDYSYYGIFRFFPVDESDQFPEQFREFFPDASDELKDAMVNQFDILNTWHMNYSTRLGEIAERSSQLEPYTSEERDPLPFIQEDYDKWLGGSNPILQDLAGSDPGDFVENLTPLRLNQQFGGGGGFGCFIGTLENDGKTLKTPGLQFGGGFGWGLSESTGFDIGFGGGMNLYPETSEFFGGGAGSNSNLLNVNDPATNRECDNNRPDCDPTEAFIFKANAAGDTIVRQIASAQFIYIACGGGGGLGYQTRAVNPDPEVNPNVFQQPFGLGGGGWSYTVVRRWDNLTPEQRAAVNPVMVTDFDDFAKTLQEYQKFVERTNNEDDSPIPQSGAAALAAVQAPTAVRAQIAVQAPNAETAPFDLFLIPVADPLFADRGLYEVTTDGGTEQRTARFDIFDFGSSNVGVVYQPYYFPIDNPSIASPVSTYVARSISSAEEFFAQWPRSPSGFDRAAADVAVLGDIGVNRVVYTLNVNPLWVSRMEKIEEIDGMEKKVVTFPRADINEVVLDKLSKVNDPAEIQPRVAIQIPLYIQHDADDVSAVPPIVSANEELLAYAVEAAAKYPNIDRILLGAGERRVVKGFRPACNGFNYTTELGCDGYVTALTFDDYYQLLKSLGERLTALGIDDGRVRIGVAQGDTAWLDPKKIGDDEKETQSLESAGVLERGCGKRSVALELHLGALISAHSADQRGPGEMQSHQ